MKTNILSISELKNIILEILFSKTDKVSKVSNTSVLNAVAFANAKIGQKALKDIAIVESQLFPEYASGSLLDEIAIRYGISSRLSALGSSAYIYLYGIPGTVYLKSVHKFISGDGITFELEEDTTIPVHKFTYAKIKSVEVGVNTNVEALSIVTCISPPVGHTFCVNEFAATGGRDTEDDEALLFRIQHIHSTFSIKTMDYLLQLALSINSNILKLVFLGTQQGKTKIGVLTQNGATLSELELTTLLDGLKGYFSLVDLSETLSTTVTLSNVTYTPIDLSFRINYSSTDYTIEEIYSLIQRKLTNYLDFRYWDFDKKVQWGDLYNICKNSEGVLSLPYAYFSVNGGQNDVTVAKDILPKFRSFLIYDLEGSSLLDIDSTSMAPILYPEYINKDFNEII